MNKPKPAGWRQRCIDSAKAWAKAWPSDPFAYGHALAMMESGAALPSDFDVEFRYETRSYSNGNRVVEYGVEVPTNIKRP